MPPSVNFLGHWSQVNSFPLLWLLLCISKWQNNENNIGHLITRCKVLWKCRKMPPILDYKNPEVSEKCHWFFTETPLKCRFFGKKDSPENAADFLKFYCRTFWSMVIKDNFANSDSLLHEFEWGYFQRKVLKNLGGHWQLVLEEPRRLKENR